MRNEQPGAVRHNEIDWLRVLAVVMLVPFHTSRIFDSWPYYVKSHDIVPGLMVFSGFLGQWHMPLFMLLSGASTCIALRYRTPRAYVSERVKRLLVLLAFGILVIIPPQSYIRLFGDPALVWPKFAVGKFTGGPAYSASFLDFYPHFFNGIYPWGNFEWGHLWFIAYLFVFSLLALPLFMFLRSSKAGALSAQIAGLIRKPGYIFLLFIPIALIEALLRGAYPNGNQNLYSDWANFLSYLIIFIYGYLLYSDEGCLEAVDAQWKTSLILACIQSGVVFVLLMTGLTGSIQPYSTSWSLLMILRAFTTWCWLIAFIGVGRRYLTGDCAFLRYAREQEFKILCNIYISR